MHEAWRDSGAEGKANVTGANNWLGRPLARFIGFPPPGDVAVHVALAERDGITVDPDFRAALILKRVEPTG
jgi:hypothetical protein